MAPLTPAPASDEGSNDKSLLALASEVRSRIIRGVYPAGRRVTEEELAEEFGVSRMAVREALRVLATEGFVRVQPYVGTFVAEMTAKQATDLLEVMVLAIEHGDHEQAVAAAKRHIQLGATARSRRGELPGD